MNRTHSHLGKGVSDCSFMLGFFQIVHLGLLILEQIMGNFCDFLNVF